MYSLELKDARQRLNLTQLALAKELDLTVKTVNRYENGYEVPKTVSMAVRHLLIMQNVPLQRHIA
jgi:transcriptional regulator with XRE-family HTH domain